MQKLYSELIGMPVFDENSTRPLSMVQDIIIDPENGKVLAFVVSKKRVIVPLDVVRVNSGIFIADKGFMLNFGDVLRVANVAKQSIHIISSRVVTERTKTLIGRVVDYEIDTAHMMLSRIHAARVFFFFRFQERIIDSKNIVRIGKDAIVIKESNSVPIKEEVPIKSSVFAS